MEDADAAELPVAGVSRATRALLWTVLGTLALAAAMGIGSIVLHASVDFKITGSLLSVTLFGLTSMGASIVLSFAEARGLGRGWKGLMRAGVGTSALGLGLFLYMIWVEPHHTKDLAKLMAVSATLAVATATVGLLALTRFAGGWRFARTGVLAVVTIFAFWICGAILTEPRGGEEATSVLAILTGLGVVGLPVLQRLFGAEPPPTSETTRLELRAECPRCLAMQVLPAGKSACATCGLKFELKVEEPRCAGCGYLLYKLESPRCPECGTNTNTNAVVVTA